MVVGLLEVEALIFDLYLACLKAKITANPFKVAVFKAYIAMAPMVVVEQTEVDIERQDPC